MNLINLFGNKNKQPEPEYFLAVEIHESLIKTALWEIQDSQPSVVSVGSYESWADEESLINGVDSSLEQAVKVISGQPKRVIFGLPDSWMESDKIHSTKIKLISRLCKELGLEPIGAVTINRAVAHFLKKRDGVPPTTILLEVYTTKIALSYIYLGEVKATEEVAKSGDIGPDVEEGLTRMDLSNYPARFILTNGSDLSEEAQQVTAHPWQDRLPFKHLPKVESLPVDFSIKAIALIGGTEAVRFMGLEVKDDESDSLLPDTNIVPDRLSASGGARNTVPDSPSVIPAKAGIHQINSSESDNLQIPDGDIPSISEHGFFYEEVSPPTGAIIESSENLPSTPPTPKIFDLQSESTEYTEPEPDSSTIIISPKKSSRNFSFPKIKLPQLPKIKFGGTKKSFLGVLVVPVLLLAGIAAYLFFGSANIILHFSPQKFTQTLNITIATSDRPGIPTLVATPQKISSATKESLATTGQATVGDKATGKVAIFNRSTAPLVLKSGTVIASENGKNLYTLTESVTIASKSADLLSGSEVFGKVTGTAVTSTKIGAEYNMSKDSTFSVSDFSKTISYAIAETDISGGTSRAVNAVSKADQEKLLAQATEKIKENTSSQVSQDSPGKKAIPASELQFTKKVFDKNIGEESTTLNLELEGSLETLVYSDQDLFDLVNRELKSKLPPSTTIEQATTDIKVENPQKKDGDYQAVVSISTSLYPQIDEEKLKDFVKGKSINNIRHFFEPIKGFVEAEINVTPPIPLLTKILPYKNIRFQLVAN